jgi:hypothetical protein
MPYLSLLGDASPQRQCMQLRTHPTLKRLVDHLVLLHPAFAGKRA